MVVESLGYVSRTVSPRFPQWRLQCGVLRMFSPTSLAVKTRPLPNYPLEGGLFCQTGISNRCRPPAIYNSRAGKPWTLGHISCGRFYVPPPSGPSAGLRNIQIACETFSAWQKRVRWMWRLAKQRQMQENTHRIYASGFSLPGCFFHSINFDDRIQAQFWVLRRPRLPRRRQNRAAFLQSGHVTRAGWQHRHGARPQHRPLDMLPCPGRSIPSPTLRGHRRNPQWRGLAGRWCLTSRGHLGGR